MAAANDVRAVPTADRDEDLAIVRTHLAPRVRIEAVVINRIALQTVTQSGLPAR